MNVTTLKHGAAVVLLAALLSGCSESADLGTLRDEIQRIRADVRGRIEPPPEFKPIALYTYSAHLLREPFRLAVEPEKEQQDGIAVEPDLNRLREPLEDFNFDVLRMVGSMNPQGKPMQALIRDGLGNISRVQVGHFLGKNHGRITALDEGHVAVTEIIPDGRGGWVERPRVIMLSE